MISDKFHHVDQAQKVKVALRDNTNMDGSIKNDGIFAMKVRSIHSPFRQIILRPF
jgi:hypothetical protein